MTRETLPLKRILVITTVIIAVALLFVPRLEFIRYEGSDGELLWKEGEAYLFIGDAKTGFRLSLFDYLLEPVREYFYATALPSDTTSSFTIMKITPSGIERYDDKSRGSIWNLTPVSDEIYVGCLQGVCKWTGTQFQAVSEDETRKIGGKSRLTNNDFSDVDGWSRRRIWNRLVREQLQPYTYSADLKNGTKLVVSGYNPVSIDLLRSGHSSERIWYNKAGTRTVSPSEYQRTFRQR